ncbi:MAG: hypothetical protein KGO81_06525 [Bacteroidota bacterium]|nr:hypothetical protein [Bacteroidota bacterium]
MKAAKNLCLALLVFSALLSIVMGFYFITDPSGHNAGASTEDLKGTPFSDYLIPGWILAGLVGGGSIIAFLLGYLKNHAAPKWFMGMGIVLWLWLLVQLFVISQFNFVAILFFFIALALLFLGNMLRKQPAHTVVHADTAAQHAHKTHKKKHRGHHH